MRVAFTSCMSTQVFDHQPIWDTIRSQQPHHLLITGDSIYIDAKPTPTHPKEMSHPEFANHVHGLYRDLLIQPQFRSLAQQVPTHAIWDDHDFLWNESYREKAVRRSAYDGHILLTRWLFNAFTHALDQRLASGSFPSSVAHLVPVSNIQHTPPPGYRCKQLANDVWLHLTDGRSWRLKKDLLGQDQRHQIAARIQTAAPGTVHLLASGSMIESHKHDQWGSFDDHAWLLDLARQHNILVLSGDIHANQFTPIDLGDNRWLFDATSSGAAIRKGVTLLSECRNHGVVDIKPTHVAVKWYAFGQDDRETVVIDRATWRRSA